MRGRLPKPDHLRQRRNKVATAAQLPTEESSLGNDVPELPARAGGWHPNVTDWWTCIWQSPMASEYLAADMKSGLFLLAELYQIRWTTKENSELLKAAAEIRLQEVRFGLSPIDRQRLRWTIEQGEAAAERTEARRESKAKAPKASKDPRATLKMVG